MRFWLKAFSLVILLLPLQGCFTYSYFHFKYVHHLRISALIGGTYNHIKNYDVFFYVDGVLDTLNQLDKPYFDNPSKNKKAHTNDQSALLVRGKGFCSTLMSGGDIWGCNNHKVFNDISVRTVLVENATQKKFILDERILKISEHINTTVHIQVYFASDKDQYLAPDHFSSYDAFDWNAAKLIYSEDLQDSLYLYTKIKYSDEPNY